MYKNVLENINGVEIFPIISLIVFFIFFIVVVIWVLKADKSYLSRMSNLPLEGNNVQGGSK